jgi:hypothetical protein
MDKKPENAFKIGGRWINRSEDGKPEILFPIRHFRLILQLMKKHLSVALVAACLLTGCKSPGHVDPGILNRVSQGMTKQQVIQAVGGPESVAADGNTETLYYVEERPWWQWRRMQVKLVDGKVVSYGEANPK